RGDLDVTLEEGTWAAWLYDLLRPYVTEVLVCDPRKNALLKVGNKSDRIDARKLAERGGKNAKKRAVVAVSRKLAVLLHKLWVSGEDYEPLRNSQKAVSAVA